MLNGVQYSGTLDRTVSSQSVCLLPNTGHVATVSSDVREIGEDVGVYRLHGYQYLDYEQPPERREGGWVWGREEGSRGPHIMREFLWE